jgi:hypothetical protein
LFSVIGQAVDDLCPGRVGLVQIAQVEQAQHATPPQVCGRVISLEEGGVYQRSEVSELNIAWVGGA